MKAIMIELEDGARRRVFRQSGVAPGTIEIYVQFYLSDFYGKCVGS